LESIRGCRSQADSGRIEFSALLFNKQPVVTLKKFIMGEIKLFAGTAGRALAEEVGRELGVALGEAEVGRFADGEVRIRLLESVRDKDVFILNSLQPPAENIIEMILLSEAARSSSAGRITLVPSYLSYNRKDRKDEPRVPISASVIAQTLSGFGANRALLLDLHSEPTIGFFSREIVADHLYASTVGIPYLKTIMGDNFVVASPDKGGSSRADAYARKLGREDYVLFTKARPKAGEIQEGSIKIIGDVAGKDVLLVDDMIDTAGTVMADARAAKEAGARELYVFATHALFSKDAVKRLDESLIKEVVVTDTVNHAPEELQTKRVKITVLKIAPLVAKAIRSIHDGGSVSSLIL